MDKVRMIMKRYILLIISALVVNTSCEQVWEEVLKEKALDSIRGYYEIESGIWNESGPIDINGDGIASYDYYSEWLSIPSGVGYNGSCISNDGGYIEIPYIIDSNAGWGGPISLSRRVEKVKISIDVLIEDREATLAFSFPENTGITFEHSGYGEFTITKTVSFTVTDGNETTEQITGRVTLKFKRTIYRTE